VFVTLEVTDAVAPVSGCVIVSPSVALTLTGTATAGLAVGYTVISVPLIFMFAVIEFNVKIPAVKCTGTTTDEVTFPVTTAFAVVPTWVIKSPTLAEINLSSNDEYVGYAAILLPLIFIIPLPLS
jgi:hypothetical protein